MADRYLYSGAGTHTSPYTDPDEPAATLAQILALTGGDAVAAGEVIWVHEDHFCGYTAQTMLCSPASATAATPQKMFCVDNFTDMNLSTGGEIGPAPGANREMHINGCWVMHGINISSISRAASFGGGTYQDTVNEMYLLDCGCADHSTSYPFLIFSNLRNGADCGRIVCKNLRFEVGHASSSIGLGTGQIEIENMIIDSSVGILGKIFTIEGTTVSEIINSDFSSFNYTALISGATDSIGRSDSGTVRFINCKLRTGSSIIANIGKGSKVYLINCDDGNTNYRWELYQYYGTIKIDTSVYATTSPAIYEELPAPDNYRYYSLKMSTNANVSRYLPLQSEWVHKWYDAGEHTLNVECLVGEDDADALTTDELYLEVDYISGASSPLGSRSTTAPDILTTGGNVTAGTTAWTGDSYTTERTHKLSATVTSTKNGYIRYRVCLAKPSTIVYFNPV